MKIERENLAMFLEREVKSIDASMPIYLIAIAIFSFGHSFLLLGILGLADGYYFPISLTMFLIQPYFLLVILASMWVVKLKARDAFRLLREIYGKDSKSDEDPIRMLGHLVARARRLWELTVLIIFVYFAVTAALTLFVMVLF